MVLLWSFQKLGLNNTADFLLLSTEEFDSEHYDQVHAKPTEMEVEVDVNGV